MTDPRFTEITHGPLKHTRNIWGVYLQKALNPLCAFQDKSRFVLHVGKIGKPVFHKFIVWHIMRFSTKLFYLHGYWLPGSTKSILTELSNDSASNKSYSFFVVSFTVVCKNIMMTKQNTLMLDWWSRNTSLSTQCPSHHVFLHLVYYFVNWVIHSYNVFNNKLWLRYFINI